MEVSPSPPCPNLEAIAHNRADFLPPCRQEENARLLVAVFDVARRNFQRRDVAVVAVEQVEMRDAIGNEAFEHILSHSLHGLEPQGQRKGKLVIVDGGAVRQAGRDDHIVQPLCDSFCDLRGDEEVRPQRAVPAVALAGAKRHDGNDLLLLFEQLLHFQRRKFIQKNFFTHA